MWDEHFLIPAEGRFGGQSILFNFYLGESVSAHTTVPPGTSLHFPLLFRSNFLSAPKQGPIPWILALFYHCSQPSYVFVDS